MEMLESLKSNFPEIKKFELVGIDYIIDESKEVKNFVERVEDGVKWVKAPEMWAKGHKGKGITIGVIDTGAFVHPDLRATYRGRNGDHNHNWFDALNGRKEPYDDHFHGTHCHGTITGSSSNLTVGVSIETEWVSCKYLSAAGGGNVADCIKCMQFMLNPTDLNGENGDSDRRPHLVSNSYGGSHNDARETALKGLLAAGVEMVYAAGNSARCNTIGFPARYDVALAVGALNKNSDTVASFSSRGPGTNNRLKPEISAPGANVISTAHTGGYRTASGTSMACPHVAGAIALLWSAKPNLVRKIDDTRKLFYETAKHQQSRDCNSNATSPNNVYGYGTIDILKAFEN